jgi:hypothetical protein
MAAIMTPATCILFAALRSDCLAAQIGRSGSERLLVSAEDRESGAMRFELARSGQPDTAVASGNDGNFVQELLSVQGGDLLRPLHSR